MSVRTFLIWSGVMTTLADKDFNNFTMLFSVSSLTDSSASTMAYSMNCNHDLIKSIDLC